MLKVVNIHHQETDAILATVGTNFFGPELFEHSLLVDETRMTVAHGLVAALFELAGAIVGEPCNTGKGLEQFLFVIVVRHGTAAFKANGNFCCLGIMLGSNRHHQNLAQVQVLAFGIIQPRQVVLEARQEGTFHGTVAQEGQYKDALVRKRKGLVCELFGIHTVAEHHMTIHVVALIQGENRQAVVSHVGLHVIDNLLVNVLHRHGLEELAQVTVKSTVLLQGNVLLSRIEALVVQHRNRASNKLEGAGRRIVKGIGVHRIHDQGTYAETRGMINQRHGHHRLDRRIVDIVHHTLGTRKVTFQKAVHVGTKQLAQKSRSFSNAGTEIYRNFLVVRKIANAPFLLVFHLRKHDDRIHMGNHNLQGQQHVGHGAVNIGVGTGPDLAHLESGLGFIGHTLGGIGKFVLQSRGNYRCVRCRTILENRRNGSRCWLLGVRTGKTRAIHAGKHKRDNGKGYQEQEHSPLECKAKQKTRDHEQNFCNRHIYPVINGRNGTALPPRRRHIRND